MEGEPNTSAATKRARQETNLKLCIKCQQSDSRRLVTEPSLDAYSKFLTFIHKQGQYGDNDFPEISHRLRQVTDTELRANKASWHRTCYSETCHSGHLERARVRYEKACQHRESQKIQKRRGRPSSMDSTPSAQASSEPGRSDTHFTRSLTAPFKKEMCFFCQEDTTGQDIHKVSTFNAGEQLQNAVGESNNETWKVHLSAAISADDACAIDIKYHLACWVKHVQRAPKRGREDTEQSHLAEKTNVGIIASDIEFICLVRSLLKDGPVSMAERCLTYKSILQSNGIHSLQCECGMKKKLISHIDDIHFMKPKRQNESEQIFSTALRDAAMEEVMTQNAEKDICQLFQSASILRKAIEDQTRHPWEFDGTLNASDTERHVPNTLYSFIKWILQGPTKSLQTEATIHQDVLAISQNIMYSYKSTRQVTYKPRHIDAPFRHRLEWPQLLAVGIAVHQSTRSKKHLDFLHGFGLSVDYSRIMRLETQLASSVIEATRAQGTYLPSTMHVGSFIFFAVDNSDFNEDTPDGKRTLHATATALYQRREQAGDSQENTRKLRLHGKARDRSLKSLTSPNFVPCFAPNRQVAKGPSFAGFKTGSAKAVLMLIHAKDSVWLLSRTIARTYEVDDVQTMDITLLEELEDQLLSDTPQHANSDDDSAVHNATQTATPPGCKTTRHNIPTWTAYNSLLASEKPVTEVAALPLVAAPAHEWQTLLTVLKQTQQINCMVVGPDRKTVITLDMALYERAKQLEMSRDDCKGKWILRLGEMHTVMAALRAVGNAIEDSGLDEAWSEADIYGPTTTRQILEAKHMKGALEAHITTVQALYDLYVEEFFIKHPHLRDPCVNSAEHVDKSCAQHNRVEMIKEQENMLATLESNKVLETMAQFDEMKEARSPLLKFVWRYMRMVLLIYAFIRATRDGLWELHLASLDELCKYFFAHDKQKYARLVPLYLAEMTALQTTDPDIHQEFMAGNFTVNKNQIPFCAVGVDHALEHINRIMKVTGGLVGITQNASARERFFLTAPELGRLAEEAHQMAGTPTARRRDHELSTAVWSRQEENILRLKNIIRSSTNPMTYEGGDLMNIITKIVMPLQVQKDVCSQDEIGQQKYTAHVEERITNDTVSVWARMKKVQLRMWKSARKAVKHKLADQVVELKDDRTLFARMLIVARSRPEINVKEAIGQHEFTSLPRALFAKTGELLPCTDKSQLMAILENLPKQSTTEDGQQPVIVATDDVPLPSKKVTVIDGMAVVQAMGKPAWIKTCAEWAEHFITTLVSKTKDCDEVHLVFDRYNVSTSLKKAMRERRQGGKPATAYHVEDDTPIGKVSAKQFLSSTSTKDELTVYLAQKVLHHFERKSETFIVNSRQDVFSNHVDVRHLRSSQEEADTRIILHSLDAVRRGATELYIQSPDTDVLVLLIRRYHQLCKNTYFVTGTGNKKWETLLAPIVHALGAAKAAALPGFHAFTGADQMGRFAGKGKLKCWLALNKCSAEVVSAFAALGASCKLTTATEGAIEAFVCQLYEPGTTITVVADLRWRLFTKKQLEAQSLPPTRGALKEAIARAHYQAMVWYQDNVPEPHLPPATENGWKVEGGGLVATPTMELPAPTAVTHLIKCGCKKGNCQSHCSCRSQNLNCSEMCMCGADEEVCSNVGHGHLLGLDDNDEDNDPLM